MVTPFFLRQSSEFALFILYGLIDIFLRKKCRKNQKRKKKNLHLHVRFHTSAIPHAFEMLSFLTCKFNFLLLCNLFLVYSSALENCVAPFHLIRVIPKWLFASMKIRVKGMKCMSAEEPRQ